MDLELRHMRAVCAIGQAGSLTKAALVLGMSQPALTAQLKRIEREVGGRLFDRDRRGAVPTPLGEFVLTRARAVLLGVDELRRGPRHDEGRPDCPRTVSLGGASGAVWIGLAERLADHLPDAQVRVQQEYSPRLLWDLVTAGRLDAGAIIDYPGYELQPVPGVGCEVIATEPVFVALWAGHPLAAAAEVDLADLADQPWAVTPPDGAGWPGCLYAACRRAGFLPRTPYLITDSMHVREVVASRRAIAPCQAVFAPGAGIVVRPLAGTPLRMRHLLVWRRDGPLARHAGAMLRLGRESYWSSVSRAPDYVSWLRRQGRPAPLAAVP